MNLEKQDHQNQWYYLDAHNATQGPVTEAELQKILLENIIHPNTYIWCEGMQDWQKYQDLFNLTAHISADRLSTSPISKGVSPFPATDSTPSQQNSNQVVFEKIRRNFIQKNRRHAASFTC